MHLNPESAHIAPQLRCTDEEELKRLRHRFSQKLTWLDSKVLKGERVLNCVLDPLQMEDPYM